MANRIAAGEVVQRPESVIKELVENALDAEASEIAVFVRSAGKKLIHILDNGRGISEEDLPLTVKRHATSKIYEAADLERIISFGFRGEALASIASVANIEIRSKRREDELGSKLISTPNAEPTVEAVNTENGTQIFVRNLFYNVPARRKFLRSDLTEFKHISETMAKFALAEPSKRFTFYDNNSLIFDRKPEDLRARIAGLFGSDTGGKILPVDYSDGIIKISGYIGKPELAKKTGKTQYLFLNSRSIISKSLSYAVFLAFENLIEKGFKPFYVLKIELDPTRVDINVHPQKHEVKFDDEALVHNALKRSVLDALRKEDILLDIDILQKKSESPIEKVYPDENSDDFMLVNSVTGEIVGDSAGVDTAAPRYSLPSGGKYRKSGYSGTYSGGEPGTRAGRNQNNYSPEISAFEECFGNIDEQPEETDNQGEIFADADLTENRVWQADSNHLICKFEEKLVFVDILRARRRILYEKNLERLKKRRSVSQKLLFPVVVELPVSKKAVLDEIFEEIEKFGFAVKESGDKFEIMELPPEINESNGAKVFEEIIDSYHDYKLLRTGNLTDNLAAAIAVNAYIPKNENLSGKEAAALVNDLFKCRMPNLCPRGKKTVAVLARRDMEAMFA